MSIETTLATYHFTLTLAGVVEMTDELQGKLLQVGCDDASLWSEGQTVFLSFDREAESLGDAIGSAVNDVARAGFSVARVEVEPANG
jgi:hypothetical protein